ncbi:MAG: hypothetical protein K2X47_00560 [Bdellovibrionales bacterium]|nr:hypothetical protein [Bdellovibrionales bacterium]
MKSHKWSTSLAIIIFTAWLSPVLAAEPAYHDFETVISHELVRSEFENTETARFNLDQLACLSRVEISVAPTQGTPTLFLFGGDAFNPDPLDQDLLIGTITTGQNAANYSFRVNRMSRQTSLKIAGGRVRVLSVKSVLIPDRMCPEMAKHLSIGWVKYTRELVNEFKDMNQSKKAKIAVRNSLTQIRILELAIGSGSDLSNPRLLAPDTHPQVRQAATSLACDLTEEIIPFGDHFSVRTSQFQNLFQPLMNLAEEIFETYATSAVEECSTANSGDRP